MKKLFFCMACVGLLAVSAWAVDEKNVRNEKITDIAVSPVSKAAGNIFNGKKVYYLDGFGKDYKKR